MIELGAIVYVVDGDASSRAAIGSLLSSAGLTVQCFTSASAFLARLPSTAPGCLILELHLPDGSGLDLQRELTEREPIPIVFIAAHGDIPTSVRAIKAGAMEFLSKPFRNEDLLSAIEVALAEARDRWRSRSILSNVQSRFAALTPRERQVLSHVVTGMLNKQIASALGISEVTVKGHRGQVMQKLRANSVVDLVRMAALLDVGPNRTELNTTTALDVSSARRVT